MIHPFSARICVSSTNLSSAKRLTVAGGGLLVDLWASNHFSFVTGLEYLQRGAGQAIPFRNSWLLREDSLNARYQYLSLPLLIRLRYPNTALTPYALSGLSLNFNLKSISGMSPVLDATIGVGIRAEDIIPLPAFIEGRYSFDLTPAVIQEMVVGYKSMSSNSFSIALGVLF
jgi:hypothetical protein